jgi:hypothetical protein
LNNKKARNFRFSLSVPPQGVAFIASGGIVAGIFVSNSPLTDTVFLTQFHALKVPKVGLHQPSIIDVYFYQFSSTKVQLIFYFTKHIIKKNK